MADRSQLFSDIDSLEPERFTQHLAEDVTMRFGNADEVHGRDAVHDVWAASARASTACRIPDCGAGSPMTAPSRRRT